MTRWTTLAVGILAMAMLGLVPPSGAQSAAAPAAVLTDDAGDVALAASDTPLPAPAPEQADPPVDLVALRITEAVHEMTFDLQVDDLRPASQDPSDGVVYVIEFRHEDRLFHLVLRHVLPQLSDSWSAQLLDQDAGKEDWSQLAFPDVQHDVEADTVSVTLSKVLLADSLGAPPFPGRALEGITVRAWSAMSRSSTLGIETGFVSATDQMPDEGKAPGTFPILLGPQQGGHARLTSLHPFRASNGEAATFALNATAHNLDKAGDRFTLRATGLPAGMQVRFPVQTVDIDAEGTANVTVLVTVPFAHVHGATASFVLELASDTDPQSVGRLQLGILYLPIPQPAGHHDTLVLHSGDDATSVDTIMENVPGVFGYDAWMNTLETDPSDTGKPVPPSGVGNLVNPGPVSAEWDIPLEPGLAMGLDFDLARVGRLNVPLGTTSPMMGATLSASLQVRGHGHDSLVVATMAATPPQDLNDRQPHVFSGDVVATPTGDLVPYMPDQQLVLVLWLNGTQPVAAPGPYLAPGGSMALPLQEYQDPLDPMLAAAPVVAGGEASEAPAAKHSPGLEVPLLLAAVAVAVVSRRRTA